MIKLLSFEEFMKHPMFTETEGLCTNLNRVYYTGPLYQVRPSVHLMNYCDSINVSIFYPIKTSDCSGHDLFVYSRRNNFLYKGVQLELRKKLYTNVINWMAKNYPKEYVLCTN